MFKYHILALLIGTILDYVFGRIYSLWNPFDSIKNFAIYLQRALLGDEIILTEPSKQKSLGLWMLILVLFPVFVIITFFTTLFYEINLAFGIIFEAIACYFCIEYNYTHKISDQIMGDYYSDGFDAMVNSCHTFIDEDKNLETEARATEATVTFIANNTSDSIIGPIFIMFFFGPIGGFLYKTLDIVDGIIGYHNNRFEYFGYYTATLNKIVNYIPSRFSGALVIFCSKYTFGEFNHKNARYIHLRDRIKAISAFAGALGFKLKDGQTGDDDTVATAKDIRRANRLLKNSYLVIQLVLVILLVFF